MGPKTPPQDDPFVMRASGFKGRKRLTADDWNAFEREVLEAAFRSLPTVFPEFGWESDSQGGWRATNRETTKSATGARPDRVICKKPGGYYIYGVGPVSWIAYLNGGTYPSGPQYVETLKALAARAGVDASILDRPLTDEENARRESKARRHGVLEAALGEAQENLWSSRGDAARAFLRERGLQEEAVRDLGLGLMPPAVEIRNFFGKEAQAAEEAGLLSSALMGRIVFPWNDENGLLMTFCARVVGKGRPDEKKFLMLPGAGTTTSPLYLDRALKAKHQDRVVLVEGALDAAVLHAHGDLRVVANMGAQLSQEQVKALARRKVQTVVIVTDPDEAGEKGAVRSSELLLKAGIRSFIAPPIPGGLDPDELLLRHGLDAWKAHVAQAKPGPVYQAGKILEALSDESSDMDRRAAVEKVLDLVESLKGPHVALDREDVLRMLAERTGYSWEALSEEAATIEEIRSKERLKAETTKALKEAQAALERGSSPELVLAKLEAGLSSLPRKVNDDPPFYSVDQLNEEAKNEPEGKSLGWPTLDNLEVSLNPGELTLLAARTGHGKTTAMLNVFLNTLNESASDDERVYLFYSCEEQTRPIHYKMQALMATRHGGVWTAQMVRRWAKYNERYEGEHQLRYAQEDLRRWGSRMMVIHRPSWTVADIEAHARRMAKTRPIALICADFLQRINPPTDMGKGRRRDEEISIVARRFKALAGDLDAPIVTGAQINRKAIEDSGATKIITGKYRDADVQEAIAKRRPQLHNLREGGSEQEADVVLGLLNYRADFTEDGSTPTVPDVTKLEVGVLKARYGVTGRWGNLAYEAATGLIREWYPEEEF